MLTPDRALVAYASMEDVFTPEGDAVVIVELYAAFVGATSTTGYFARVANRAHAIGEYALSDLTAREDLFPAADIASVAGHTDPEVARLYISRAGLLDELGGGV